MFYWQLLMQCQNLKRLSELDNFRFISCCEHGTLHITWEWLTLHLQPGDFRKTARLLALGDDIRQECPVWIGDNCCLVRQPDGGFQIWFGDIMLLLSATKFACFAQLVQEGLRVWTDSHTLYN